MSTAVQCNEPELTAASTPPPAHSKSFCIEAILARSGEDVSARGSDDGSPRSLSPAISPGCETTMGMPTTSAAQTRCSPLALPGAASSLVPRPGVLGAPLLPATIYGFPGHLLQGSGTSAFHPLEQAKSLAANSGSAGAQNAAAAAAAQNAAAAAAAAAGQQQFHPMQLEWFARTGIFYPRLPDLTGQLLPTIILHSMQLVNKPLPITITIQFFCQKTTTNSLVF